MSSVLHNIAFVRGDTYEFGFTVDGDIGTVTSVRMTARRAVADSEPLFSLSLGSGVTATDDGWEVRVPPAATKAARPGLYRYDVEVQYNGGADTFTPIYGQLNLIEDVTVEV